VCLSASLAADSLADNAAFWFHPPGLGQGCRPARSAMICDGLDRGFAGGRCPRTPGCRNRCGRIAADVRADVETGSFSSAVAEPVLMILRVATSTSRQSMRTSENGLLGLPDCLNCPARKPPSPILVSLERIAFTLAVNMKSAVRQTPPCHFLAPGQSSRPHPC